MNINKLEKRVNLLKLHMKKYYTLLIFVFCSFLLNAQNYNIEIPTQRFQVDETNKIIICKIDITLIPDLSSYESVSLELDNIYTFTSNPNLLSHQDSYIVERNGDDFSLYFTIFPLAAITSQFEIVDEPKRLADFVYADDEEIKTSFMGVELRGGASQTYPKKTYDLEFWEDPTGDESIDLQFGDLREDDDWILDALYNEPLRLRAHSSHQLWLEMHTPHYINEEEDAKAGANVMYIDLFLNNEYIGVYMLSEQVDRKQLKIKKYNNDIRGELYKAEYWVTGNCIYYGLPPFDNTNQSWGGYKLKHPDPDDVISWDNLYNFTDFVINSELPYFNNNIAASLQIENALDYFIFLNLIRATDNTGKNIYTARYNQDNPYFFVPWDLDGAFGTIWNGSDDPTTDDILSNGLFDKLIHETPTVQITNQIRARWADLRQNGPLHTIALNSRLTGSYNLLKDNKVYEREALVWQNYPYSQDTKDYMDIWLLDRLEYLDDYFDFVLDTNEFKEKLIMLYPNPANTSVTITRDSLDSEVYSVFSMSGALLKSGILESSTSVIAVDYLSSGVYLLKIGDATVKRLIIE